MQDAPCPATTGGAAHCTRPLDHQGHHRTEQGYAFFEEAPRPLDQAPQAPSLAADPALDALDNVEKAHNGYGYADEDDFATIRAALADRITPAEARALLGPMDADPGLHVWQAAEVKLRRIADRETGR